MFAYDFNGNMTSGNDRTVSYNSANKVTRIDHNADVARFAYGADGNRVLQSVGTATSGSSDITESARTIYVGLGATGKSMYERTERGTTTEHVHFIYAGGIHGGSAFALRVLTEDSSAGTTEVALKYNHFDHLGSVTAMSDELGRVIGPASGGTNATLLGYDPWGARRNPDGTAADSASFALHVGHREYTGHETIPNVGLVNMNGRVYDPELGRFLSADPQVQFVADLQSYNRYSYVLNNPLRYTDPTGYGIFSFLKNPMFWVQTLPTMVICVAGGPAACTLTTIYNAIVTTTAMLTEGASWSQVGKVDLAIGAGMLGGAIGGWAVSGWQSGGIYAAVLAGGLGGGIGAALSTPLTGGDLGSNVLAGVGMGAVMAGITYGLTRSAPVSQASAEPQQGGGSRVC